MFCSLIYVSVLQTFPCKFNIYDETKDGKITKAEFFLSTPTFVDITPNTVALFSGLFIQMVRNIEQLSYFIFIKFGLYLSLVLINFT